MSDETIRNYVLSNRLDASKLQWTDQYSTPKIHLSEDEWNMVSSIEENMLLEITQLTPKQAILIAQAYKEQYPNLRNTITNRTELQLHFDVTGEKAWIVEGEDELFGDERLPEGEELKRESYESAGDDYLQGNAGNDNMYGGKGHDTYVVEDKDTIYAELFGIFIAKNVITEHGIYFSTENVSLAKRIYSKYYFKRRNYRKGREK